MTAFNQSHCVPPAQSIVRLTNEQQAAAGAIGEFIKDARRQLFVLHGTAGTGKTTLLRHVATRFPDFEPTPGPLPICVISSAFLRATSRCCCSMRSPSSTTDCASNWGGPACG
jgi:hypothetical protein